MAFFSLKMLLKITILLISVAFANSETCTVCPQGWSPLEHLTMCYRVYTTKKAFPAAVGACTRATSGGKLMSVEIANSIVSDMQRRGKSGGILRMNAQQVKVGKRWRYKTHDNRWIQANIDGWITEKKIDSRATATIRPNGVWQQKYQKGEKLNYACEVKGDSQPCESEGKECTVCPGNWRPLYARNMCYKVFNEDNDEKLSFVDAANRCPTKSVGSASLLSVASIPDVMIDLAGVNTGGACRVDARQKKVGVGKWAFRTHDDKRILNDISILANDITRNTDATLTIDPLKGDIQQKYRAAPPMSYICEMPMDFDTEYCPETTTQPATTGTPATVKGDARMEELVNEESFNIERTYSGQIYSPNFGVEAYPEDWSANYFYQPKTDKTIKLVGFYNLDDADETGFCADRITIHEGLNKEDPVRAGPFCGEGALPDQIIEPGSSGRLIRFESDSVKNKAQSFYYFQAKTWSHGKQVQLESEECVTLDSPNKQIQENEEGGIFIVCGPNQQKLKASFLSHPDQCFYDVKFYEGSSETTRKNLHETQCNDAYVAPEDIRTVDENCLSIEMEYRSTGTPKEFLNLQVCSTA